MRISDWSSDVCSSDLLTGLGLDAETAGDANQGQRCLGTRTGDLECGGASGLGQRPVRQERATPRGDRVAATTGDHLGREATNWPALLVEQTGLEIGRASCRERVCQYVSISVVAVSLKNKKK